MKINGSDLTAMTVDAPVAVLPLATLQPVADMHHQWTALTLCFEGDTGADLRQLIQLFNRIGLFEMLDVLPLLLPVSSAAQLESGVVDNCLPHRVLLRVPVAFCADPALRERLRLLRAKGFRLLLDGVPQDINSMLDEAQGLGLNCLAGVPAGASQWLYKSHGPHLAEGVADMARFEQCRTAGFGWFAGAYPLHPSCTASCSDGTTRSRLLKLLGLVAQDAESCELEMLLKQDPALSYQLLRLANSAAFPHSHQITSFGQALNLLGRRQLQRWLQLLLFARQHENAVINPLLPHAALRARMMEVLCEQAGGSRNEQDRAFMTGIFSLLEVLFGMPLAELIQPLALTDDISDALLMRSGELGRLLNLVEMATSGGGVPTQAELDACTIGPEAYWQGLIQAFSWAMHVSREM
jgi:c-di-GMP phosphodiesterase